MKQVANKKMIRTLSYRTMKEKKWKNLIAVLAIGLTSLMFTAMFTTGLSIIGSMQEATMRQVGTSAHGGYKYMTEAEYEQVKQAGGYRDISYNVFAGSGVNTELNQIQTEVRFAEDKMAEWSFSYPETGHMPETINECAASSKVLEALGIPMELGAKVPIQIRTEDEQGRDKIIDCSFILSGFWQSDEAAMAQQFYISEEWMKKNIVRPVENYFQRMDEERIASIIGRCQVDIVFSSAFDIEGQMKKLTDRTGLNPEDVNESVNWAYATATVDFVTIALGVTILGIIMLSGYLIIYNIFYINVTADIRYYGLLKTIGTTGKQLKKMVRGQAFLLSAAGIPLGLAGGWFVGKGIMPVLFGALDTGGIQNVAINPGIFIFAAAFSLIVVYISCIRPCRLATRVSPIEAVRFVEAVPYKKKTKKTGNVTMLRMAAANMSRNKKKAAAVISSLALSLILINTTYSMVRSFSFDEYVKNYLVSDMMVNHYSAVNSMTESMDFEAITPEIEDAIQKIDGVEGVHTFPTRNSRIFLTEEATRKFETYYHSDEVEDFQKRYGKEEADYLIRTGDTSGNIYGMGTDILKYLTAWQGKLDPEKFGQGGYAIIINSEEDGNWVSAGDKIVLENEQGLQKELQVMAVADLPYGLSVKMHMGLFPTETIISIRDFDELYQYKGGLNAVLDVAEGKEEAVKKELEAYLSENQPELVLSTKDELEQEFARETRMFTVIGGLLGFILALIGILNFINATITGILSRKQEFAMMQAVGMTGKQLEHMLILEGLLYGTGTLLVSLTFGNLVSYGFIYMMGKNMAYFVWNFTIAPIILSIPVIIVISVILPVICYHILCKKSIIERLRLAEV